MTHVKQNPLIAFAGLIAVAVVALIAIGSVVSPMAAEAPAETAEAVVPSGSVPPPADSGDQGVGLTGAFEGVSPYTITGIAEVVVGDDGQRVLSLSDEFSTNRGPQLVIYLRAEDGSFVNLGDLQGLEGAQDFAIPDDVDLDLFTEVQVWCEPFGINFGSAFLGA